MRQSKARAVSVAVALLVGGVALSGCGSKATDSRAAAAGGSTPAGTTGTAPSSGASSSSSGSPATSAPPSASSVSGAPNGSSATTAGGPVLIVRSAAGAVSFDGRRPTTIGFSGDSSNVVTRLTWSSWGPTTAVGHGSWGHDDCQPNCAQGTVTQVPATIRLSDVVDGDFTAIREQAQGLDHTYRYPSHWATSASTG